MVIGNLLMAGSCLVLCLIGGRYIEVFLEDSTAKRKVSPKGRDQAWQRMKKDDEEEEDLSESGRLFVRNLPYTSTEEDLEKIFSKHGRPPSERHLSVMLVENPWSSFTIAFHILANQIFPERSTSKESDGIGPHSLYALPMVLAWLLSLDMEVRLVTIMANKNKDSTGSDWRTT